MKRRLIAVMLSIMLTLPVGVLSESTAWTCPNCSQTGNTGNFCSNCAAARPDGSTVISEPAPPAVVNEHLEQIPGETDRVKVIPNKVDASSFIANKKNPGLWAPENAIDRNETTCWQFSSKKGLKGKSWISLSFDSPQTVDEIWFKNGFWGVNDKGGDQYPINSRLKETRIDFLYNGETKYVDAQAMTLKDESRNG